VYAIIESGGRQYRAEEGHSFSVEKLPYEVGDEIEFDNVLLVADDEQVAVGAPYLPGASVRATVVDQYRGKKILVWKYKPKKRYRRRAGHRQHYTRLRIDEIRFNVDEALAAVEEEE
jgi:large subunit ribosomal protein L21